ncbi:hypothetical protein PIB30_090107 [Stylosanthes scabra]|uniref:Uncharacterized protein n=1 Tax=Stylosanthes scabra TaxID=79078 RepID=A0ABU6YSE2_9FABA|nr:hypothetical protein [Stylosanthes scabra]
MSEFSIQRSDKSSGPTVLQRNTAKLAKRLPGSRATMLQGYWATNEILKTMAPRLHGSENLELPGYLAVSRKVKLSEVLSNVVPWFRRSRFKSDTPQLQLAEKRQTKPTAEACETNPIVKRNAMHMASKHLRQCANA